MYKRPGVYIEESLKPLATTVADPSEAEAAFVGPLSQGVQEPVRVTSWMQFSTQFGGFGDGSSLLPFSVYQFFDNGGHAAWISRAVPVNAAVAAVDLRTGGTAEAPSGTPTVRVTAKSPGTWANNLSVAVVGGTAGRFTLNVYSGGTEEAHVVERYADLSLDPVDGRNAYTIVNSPNAGSSYVRLSNLGDDTYDVADTPTPTAGVLTLAGGTDGTGDPDVVAAAQLLGDIDRNLVLNLPGVSDTQVLNPLLTWIEEEAQNVFLVIDGPAREEDESAADLAIRYRTTVSGASTGFRPVSSQAAVYGPWLRVEDPAARRPGSMRILPPGGAVVGQYLRTDASRGVQKPPAGTQTNLRGVLDVEARFSGADLDALNQAAVNVVRPVPGAGICIMGARTLKSGTPDRYVSVRRTLMYLRKSLLDLTRFAVFEPNNSDLHDTLQAVVSTYLQEMLQVGVLAGASPDEAYFVKCDEENNPPSQIQSGVVNIEVGLALSSPAEFIVIRIGQYEGGGVVTTTTEAAV